MERVTQAVAYMFDSVTAIGKIEQGPERMVTEECIENRDERRPLAIKSVSENHTRQEGKTQSRWTQSEVGDLVPVQDFERDKHHGRKLDARWVRPRLLKGISSSEVAGFGRESYGEEAKRSDSDDLKTYCL